MLLAMLKQIPGARSAYVAAQRVWSVVRQPELFAPGHYYSPTPDARWIAENRERLFDENVDDCPGIDLRAADQLQLLEELAAFHPDYAAPTEPDPAWRYHGANDFFGRTNAFNLYAMLRRFRPRRVVEIGSGFSSAMMLDTADRHAELAETSFTFVEPHSDRLRSLLRPSDDGRCEILESSVQDVDLAVFDRLEANDFLFVDSSHVSKIGSDVNHLLFHVLPRLAPGVLVHFHDLHWPFEYPRTWIDEGRYWNEAYILRAFLQFNSAYRMTFFCKYVSACHASAVHRHLPEFDGALGSSLWIERVENS